MAKGSEDNVIYLNRASTQTMAPAEARAIFTQLQSYATKALEKLLSEVLDKVDDALFSMSEKASSTEEQSAYFETMREIRGFREALMHGFTESLVDECTQFLNAADFENDASDKPALSFEASLALSTLASRARMRCMAAIRALEVRLGWMFRDIRVNESSNPFDPRHIVDAFVVAVEPISLDPDAKLVFCKLFDRVLSEKIDSIYHACNELLEKNNVLPKMALSKPDVSEFVSNDSSIKRENSEECGDKDLYLVLSSLKSGGNSEFSGNADVGGKLSQEDWFRALRQLQEQDLDGQMEAIDHEDVREYFETHEISLRRRLIDVLGGQATMSSWGRQASDMVDIVSLMFDMICNNDGLDNALKGLLSRVAAPVLRAAMMDKTFFENSQHPARILVHEIEHACLGWQPQSGDQALYQKVETLVNRVLNEFDNDVDLFTELLEDFRSFRSVERKRQTQQDQRSEEVAHGKAKVEDAKAVVEMAVHARVEDRELSPMMRRLVFDAWSKYLFITLLREGEDSEAWEAAVDTLENLLWTTEPKKTQEEKERLDVLIPSVMEGLRNGLNSILFNPFDMTKILAELDEMHARVRAQSERSIGGQYHEETEQAAQTKADKNAPINKGAAQNSAQDSDGLSPELQARMQSLDVGTWFEFDDGQGTKTRAKLSAKLANGRRMIFVNRAGFKLAEKTIQTLVDDLDSGRCTMLDDTVLFDRALESVISNLRDMKNNP